jgi:hypothetical protein
MSTAGRIWSFTRLGEPRGDQHAACVVIVQLDTQPMLVLGHFNPQSTHGPVIGMPVECDDDLTGCGEPAAACWRSSRGTPP